MPKAISPDVKDFELSQVLYALSDPTRLEIVRVLAREGELTCGALYFGRPKSSMSHHFRILIAAGIIRVRTEGTIHYNILRWDDLESRFKGLMAVILAAD